MRVLCITNLFPNRERPLLGTFNLYQLEALSELCQLDILATIPWFPGAKLLGKWTVSGRQDDVPRSEQYKGLWVERPRTLYVPRLLGLSGPLFAASLLPRVLPYRGKIDVVFAAWAYPDGCASVALAPSPGSSSGRPSCMARTSMSLLSALGPNSKWVFSCRGPSGSWP